MTETQQTTETQDAEAGADQQQAMSTADLAYGDSNTKDEVQRETVPSQSGGDSSAAPLFDATETENYRGRWSEVQTAFVDDPRDAVQRGDQLVAETMKRLAEIFAEERQTLEDQWSRGDDVSTEDLRVALQRYRSFFDRLLSV